MKTDQLQAKDPPLSKVVTQANCMITLQIIFPTASNYLDLIGYIDLLYDKRFFLPFPLGPFKFKWCEGFRLCFESKFELYFARGPANDRKCSICVLETCIDSLIMTEVPNSFHEHVATNHTLNMKNILIMIEFLIV